jgi:hyperosmotically inducible protein
MKMMKIFMALAISAAIGFTGCKPKDADIKAAIETKMKADPDMSKTTVEVKDGVATISGECKDEACKVKCEKEVASVKGVKSVVNNCTVAAAPVVFTPPVITPDDPLTQAVTDATKDFAGVVASVKDGVITLTGEIKRDALPKLMMSLNSLKPKKIDNQLTIK